MTPEDLAREWKQGHPHGGNDARRLFLEACEGRDADPLEIVRLGASLSLTRHDIQRYPEYRKARHRLWEVLAEDEAEEKEKKDFSMFGPPGEQLEGW